MSEKEVQDIVEEGYREASGVNNMRAAQQWAKDYKFPTELLTRELAEYKAAGLLSEFAQQRHKSLHSQRLHRERVYKNFGENGDKVGGVDRADFSLLCELATTGIELIIPPEFTPISNPPKLRAKYVQVAPACNKLLAKQVEKGTVLILPMRESMEIKGVHFSCQQWTEKKGKEEGRILGDLANPADPEEIPVNGKDKVEKAILRALVEAKWGKINHPTLTMICIMIMAAADKYGWDNIELWKMDLQGAFNLLWFKATDTRLLTTLSPFIWPACLGGLACLSRSK
jgi:hypothetical protein